jgi:hypothetical protein
MSRQPTWLEVYNRFDPFLPAAQHAWRADRPRSPAGDIVDLLGGPFDGTRVLVTGTTGTGKSTELLRIAEARSGDDFVVLLDLQRHFSEVVGDEQALRNVSSWEVVFLAGLAVLRAAQEMMSFAPIPVEHVQDLQASWEKTAKATETEPAGSQIDVGALAKSMFVLASAVVGGAAGAAGAGVGLQLFEGALRTGEATAGAVKWTLPIGRSKRSVSDQDERVQSLLAAVNVVIGYVQTKLRRVLLVIDGLDRILEFERAEALFLTSELIAQLACRVVVAGPFVLHSHPARGAIPRFSKNCVVFNEPVMKKGDERQPGPGVDFFCEVFHRRVADLGVPDLIPPDLLRRLAYYSGGRVRDFVKLIRTVAEQAWLKDVDQAPRPLVDKVLDETRRLLEAGLDAGHIEVLETAAADPRHVIPKDSRAHELLDYGKLLPYPNEMEWYYPHPLLMIYMVRTPAPGSSG